MQIESYYGAPNRCYSASYAQTQIPPKLKKGKSISAVSSFSKSWTLSDPELQRKKRVASYKMYSVEGKIKGSFRKSFRWLKNKYSQVVYGWQQPFCLNSSFIHLSPVFIRTICRLIIHGLSSLYFNSSKLFSICQIIRYFLLGPARSSLRVQIDLYLFCCSYFLASPWIESSIYICSVVSIKRLRSFG